jgi:GNAT superfamily N-acetyltransferase
VSFDLRSASAFTDAELAALFTAAYEGYAIPFMVDEPTFAFMVDAFDLDVDQSLVAVKDETAVGLANLGRRGRHTWLGGVGVVQSRRREGIGELLTRSLLDRAAALGATEMGLEVIVENEPAIQLYESSASSARASSRCSRSSAETRTRRPTRCPSTPRSARPCTPRGGGTVAALRRDTRPPRRT